MAEIDKLKENFIDDKTDKELWKYLALKVGYDPSIPEEMEKTLILHRDVVGIIDRYNNTYMYKCQMYKSLGHVDFLDCMEEHRPPFY